MTTYRIDDFPKSGKIKVTPEESVIVQNRLFQEGYSWASGSKDVQQSDYNYFLYWYEKGRYITFDWDGIAFNEKPLPEYTMSLFEPKQSEGDEVWREMLSCQLPIALKAAQDKDPDPEQTLINYLKSNYKLTKL